MNIKRVLYIGSIGAVIANAAYAGYVFVRDGGMMHTMGHSAAALLFLGAAVWLHLKQRPAPTASERRDPRLDVLEDEVSELRRELSATQETLNFTEQLLTKRPADKVERSDM